MPSARETARERETFALAQQLAEHLEVTIKEAGRSSIADGLLVMGAAQALVVSFAVKKGSDLEALLEMQNKIVRNVAEALVRGDKPRFDA